MFIRLDEFALFLRGNSKNKFFGANQHQTSCVRSEKLDRTQFRINELTDDAAWPSPTWKSDGVFQFVSTGHIYYFVIRQIDQTQTPAQTNSIPAHPIPRAPKRIKSIHQDRQGDAQQQCA